MKQLSIRFLRTIVTFVAISLLMPGAAFAVQKTIGVIMTGNIPYYKEIYKSFTETLTAEGIGPGKAEVILQSPNPEPMSWKNAARKLVAVGSDVIVAYGAPATLAVLSETSDIPVVFAGVYDPQAVGIEGRNVTGVTSKVPIAGILKTFKSIVNFSRLGVVYNDSEKDTVEQAAEVKQYEGSLGFHALKFNVQHSEDTARIANVDALFMTTSCSAQHCISNVIGVAHKAKIPTATTIGGGEAGGIILTIAPSPQEQGREAARLTAKVLKGIKPSSLPFLQPKKIDMTINLKEATEIGIKIPFDLLTSATRVIK